MDVFKKILIVVILLSRMDITPGQQPGLYPFSSWIISPKIYNPAITGSKDYFSADIMVAKGEDYNSQLITVNTRLRKKVTGYLAVKHLK